MAEARDAGNPNNIFLHPLLRRRRPRGWPACSRHQSTAIQLCFPAFLLFFAPPSLRFFLCVKTWKMQFVSGKRGCQSATGGDSPQAERARCVRRVSDVARTAPPSSCSPTP